MTPETKQTFLDVFALALDTPKEIADIFVSWYPHTSDLRASVFVGGWKKDAAPEAVYDFYADDEDNLNPDNLRQLRDYVASIPANLESIQAQQRAAALKDLREKAAELGVTIQGI
jgi:hypothetical protein